MKNFKMGFGSVLLLLGLAVGVQAQPLDITLAQMDGTPYCDGLQLTVDVGDLSVSGIQTGCLSGPAFGCINYSVFPAAGTGAGLAYSGDHLGFYTQLTFNPPVWIHYDQTGNIVNYGLILYQPVSLAGRGSGVSSAGAGE
jgi:hypothetical protein